MGDTIVTAAIIAVLVALLVGFPLAARRFAARQRRLGRWDEYGPLEETEGPSIAGRGGQMAERREVIGEWKGQVLRRRRPHQPPEQS